jgi:ABC-type hemin transport system substrate-binding protein
MPAGARDARRIVSLVPSLTEALFELGLGERVVGVTEWCVHPAAAVAALPKLGGTKDPDLAAIVALRPDLVIANREENTRRAVGELRAAGLCVWVTYPRTARDGAALLEELAALGATPEAQARVVDPVREAVERAEVERPERPVAFFCPVWRDPWMAVGPDTYAHSLLELCGGRNVFAGPGAGGGGPQGSARRHPPVTARRYPRVTLEEVGAASPEVVILPDEPYAFGPRDVRELAALDIPAAREGRIHLIDGTLVSWYGPRISRAIRELRGLLGFGRGTSPIARVR